MTIRLASVAFALVAIAAVGQSSQAAQLGPYIGGAYGITERDFGKEPFDDFLLNGFFPDAGFTPSTHTSSLDAKDQGYMALIGYRISAHFAVEGMFLDLGDMTYRATTDGIYDDGEEANPLTVNTKLVGQLSGIGLYGLAIWPASYKWEFYARGGVQFTTPQLKGRVNNGYIEFQSDSSTDLVGGIGVAMSLFDIYGVRLEYMRIFDAGDRGTVEADTDFLSLGFIVAF
jgi:hypothetical protein